MVRFPVKFSEPTHTMAEEKPGTFIKKNIKALKSFFKKPNKEKPKEVAYVSEKTKAAPKPPRITPESLLEARDKKRKELEETENNENLFVFKTFEEGRKNERTDSHSSHDSGFDKGFDDKDEILEETQEEHNLVGDEVIPSFKNLTIDDGVTVKDTTNDIEKKLENLNIENETKEKKKEEKVKDRKKIKTSYVERAPIKNKVSDLIPAGTKQPYVLNASGSFRQINPQTLSGGQVTVALPTDGRLSNEEEWEMITQYIQENKHSCSSNASPESHLDLDTFTDVSANPSEVFHSSKLTFQPVQSPLSSELNSELELMAMSLQFSPKTVSVQSPMNPELLLNMPSELAPVIPEHCSELAPNFGYDDTLLAGFNIEPNDFNHGPNIPTSVSSAQEVPQNIDFDQLATNSPGNLYSPPFPTPPRSENASSPCYDQSPSYQSNSELSPILAPLYHCLSPNSDYEVMQEIVQEDGVQNVHESGSERKKTLKIYKEMYKAILDGFAKLECCQNKQDFYKEHFGKLNPKDRAEIIHKVTKFSYEECFGVLHHILRKLSAETVDNEDWMLGLFAAVCEQVLGQKPELFYQDFDGGNPSLCVLTVATTQCYKRPFLTRYLVKTVRKALSATGCTTECIFKNKTDLRGDTLVQTCVRAGDTHAAALADLLRRDNGQPSLFEVDYINKNTGDSALHMACRDHSEASPRLGTVHALLEHGKADVRLGDVKGSDSPLHLAVNSRTSDLRLVLQLVQHHKRDEWYDLVHLENRSKITPLQYAKSASKSRPNSYPPDIVNFLGRCRKTATKDE